MNKELLKIIAPITKDKQGWDAFLAILEYEATKIAHKLIGPVPTEELIRINAQYTLIDKLKNLRENALNAEREFTINKTSRVS